MVQWGDPIPVDGQRPAWLADDDVIVTPIHDGSGWCDVGGPAHHYVFEGDSSRQIKTVTHIRLPVDHWAYPAIQKGFTPWQGGEAAPDDWGGGEVLWGDGREDLPCADVMWRRFEPIDEFEIIGYRKRTEPDAVETLKQAAPASFRGEIPKKVDLSSFRFKDPIKPKLEGGILFAPTPQPSITAEFIAQVVTERDGLRKRVTDLLNANNGLVQERRDLAAELESMRGAFERSQDDLATVTVERDLYRDNPLREVPTHLTITITGPQGCGKTRMANLLQEIVGRRPSKIRDIVGDNPVSVIDTETLPPAPDVVAEEAPEYVFGPWMAPCARPIGSYVQIRNMVLCRTFPVSQVKISEPQEDSIQGRLSDCMTRAAYRIGEWHPHHPGEMPVTDDTQVQVCTRSGDIQPAARADEFEWESLTASVVAFRPVAVVAEVDVYFVPRAEAAE